MACFRVLAIVFGFILSVNAQGCNFTLKPSERRSNLPEESYSITIMTNEPDAHPSRKRCLNSSDRYVVSPSDVLSCERRGTACSVHVYFGNRSLSHESPLPFAEVVNDHNANQSHPQMNCLIENYALRIYLDTTGSGDNTLAAVLHRFLALNRMLKPAYRVEMRPKFQYDANLTINSPHCPLNCFLTDTVKRKTYPASGKRGGAAMAQLRRSVSDRGKLFVSCSSTDSTSYDILARSHRTRGSEFSYHGEALFIYIYLRTNTEHRTALPEGKAAECSIRMDFVSSKYATLPYQATLMVGSNNFNKTNLMGNQAISVVMANPINETHVTNISCCVAFDKSIDYCKVISVILYAKQFNFFDVQIVTEPHVNYVTVGSIVRCNMKFVRNDEVRKITLKCEYDQETFHSRNEIVELLNYDMLIKSEKLNCKCRVEGALHNSETQHEFPVFVKPTDIEVNTSSWNIHNTTTLLCKGKGFPLSQVGWEFVLNEDEVEYEQKTINNSAFLTIKVTDKTRAGKLIVTCSVMVRFEGSTYTKSKEFIFFLVPREPEEEQRSFEDKVWMYLGWFHVILLVIIIIQEIIKVGRKTMRSRLEPAPTTGGQIWKKSPLMQDMTKPSSVHLMSKHSAVHQRRKKSLDIKLEKFEYD